MSLLCPFKKERQNCANVLSDGVVGNLLGCSYKIKYAL